ncbi:hypothetical protein ABFS83_04G138600 [Erythranthe nasuta]
MELPQPRPIGTEGRKATHDFLSLYSSAPPAHAQQDPAPPQGGYLKTHDFLQPLEQVGKNVMSKEENKVGMNVTERPPLPAPPPPASVEHLLPGGIGTYSISYFNQRVLKPDGSLFTAQAINTTTNDENSNCSSYTGGGFTLWDESAVKKGKTGKENISAERHILQEAGVNNVAGGQWTSFLEKPSQSSSNHKTFSSFSSSQPSSSQKNQSFMDMITSAKNDQEEDDDDEEDEFVIKKEPSSHSKDYLTGNLSVKIEAKTADQKPNTPRSKHSATEQRRRSKINDRFQKLREIIPNSEQKRDKASFLLEVIDYIQFLQEKVNRCESSYNVWNHEPSKMMQWQRNCQIAEGLLDQTRGANTDNNVPASVSAATKFDEKTPIQNLLVDSDNISSATTFKERSHHRLQPESNKSKAVVQPNIFNFGTSSNTAVSPKQASSLDKTITWPPLPERNRTKDQEPTIESGTINISSVYSQGLLNTLTQALQSSGLDLSQASISVQIDLGKRANGIPHSSTLLAKDDDDDIPGALTRSRAAGAGEEFGHALKRLRTS